MLSPFLSFLSFIKILSPKSISFLKQNFKVLVTKLQASQVLLFLFRKETLRIILIHNVVFYHLSNSLHLFMHCNQSRIDLAFDDPEAGYLILGRLDSFTAYPLAFCCKIIRHLTKRQKHMFSHCLVLLLRLFLWLFTLKHRYFFL